MKSYLKIFCLVFILSTGLIACKKDKSPNLEGKASIKAKLAGAEYNQDDKIGARSSIRNPLTNIKSDRQFQFVPFNKEFVIRAELNAVSSASTVNKRAAQPNKKAAIEQGDVAEGVKYKLIVFGENGNHITERDYTRGEEANTEGLPLDGGQIYTFIAYSINSTDLPNVTHADPAQKTLSTSRLSDVDGNSDLMYLRKDMQVVGGDNFLDIVLKHLFSQITVTVDATPTGFWIEHLDVGIDSHFPTADIDLTDGAIFLI